MCVAAPTWGQTWVGGRTQPNLGEIVAVDATGESDWLFGAEDVAGDGLDTFMQQERSIDIRTAYASTTADEFYFRLYVSDSASPGGNVSGYVFIDADRDNQTGGSAVAPEIDDRFTTDASPGGYEYVFAVQGNGSVIDLWEWDDSAGEYATAMTNPNDLDAEAGTDTDPITRAAGNHGYLQGFIQLDLVGLDASCDANLYFRSLNETAALGDGDLEVGVIGACEPADRNNDGVPDLIVPDDRCTDNDQCPENASCVDGSCVFTELCETDSDCDTGEECNADGYCVVAQGDDCTDNADCETRLCESETCARCGGDGDCENGYQCAADGRCISASDVPGGTGGTAGLELEPDEEVQGGACTCSLPSRSTGSGLTLLLAITLWLWRRHD
jgi:hypothetical protein